MAEARHIQRTCGPFSLKRQGYFCCLKKWNFWIFFFFLPSTSSAQEINPPLNTCNPLDNLPSNIHMIPWLESINNFKKKGGGSRYIYNYHLPDTTKLTGVAKCTQEKAELATTNNRTFSPQWLLHTAPSTKLPHASSSSSSNAANSVLKPTYLIP